MNRILIILLASVLSVSAADQETPGARPRFRRFASALTEKALTEGKGVISEVTLKSHAVELLKFLDGEAPGGARLYLTEANAGIAGKDEFAVVAGYDMGPVVAAYIFFFDKKRGHLRRVAFFPSE